MAVHTLRFATLRLMLVILLSFAFGIAASAAPKGGGSRFVLVIDAGHGGKDNGASGRISKEKDINLSVALAFGRLVENNCPDVKVIYTRKSDVFVTLQGRADIANRNKAHLFVSIHTNSMPPGVTAPNGTETYTVGMHSGKENLAVAKRENSVITQEANYRTVYKNCDAFGAHGGGFHLEARRRALPQFERRGAKAGSRALSRLLCLSSTGLCRE